MGSPSGLFLFGVWSGGDELTPTKVLRNVALANTPQLAISVAFFFWNSHLTTMLAAHEYDQYTKRGLRVTRPQEGSKQRGTRFLSIPFRYWAPNTAIWVLLHYFASQAIFFARVDVLDHWLEPTQWSISQVGYSVLGLVCFVVLALAAFAFGIAIGLRRLANRMPLAATCSGALSAACHPKDLSVRHHEREVHWGVEVVNGEEIMHEDKGGRMVAHCTFTSGDAFYPEVDRLYA
ncbi:hypothetical protein K491DRAFT_591661 [Lophiostoma macrostomum CBS 122681]|uniref:Uncharacterized protein n=1 Tax=Lophiostoma macrostomum CBS 122681 TaxID=1314788 RepID=A0A6A6TJG8_9PLEO|nr:hypothetical protein K491DRAFT_591661 [Lophiostoma macrostomum CBS 122681]